MSKKQENLAPEPVQEPAKEPALVKVRMLVDREVEGIVHACNTVAEINADVAASLVRSGEADDHPEAIAAAE